MGQPGLLWFDLPLPHWCNQRRWSLPLGCILFSFKPGGAEDAGSGAVLLSGLPHLAGLNEERRQEGSMTGAGGLWVADGF